MFFNPGVEILIAALIVGFLFYTFAGKKGKDDKTQNKWFLTSFFATIVALAAIFVGEKKIKEKR